MVHDPVIRIDGYVIVPPVTTRDEANRNKIIADMSFTSFGRSPAEAWRRHIGPWTREDNAGEIARKTQFYFDRGYRVKKATMEIHDE